MSLKESVIRDRHDFSLDYITGVKMRYLAEKTEGGASIKVKIGDLINEVLMELLPLKAKELGFIYFVDEKERAYEEYSRETAKRGAEISHQHYLRRMAKKNVIDKEVKKLEREKERK